MSNAVSVFLALPDQKQSDSLREETLHPAGYRISAFENLEEARRAITQEAPDVILLSTNFEETEAFAEKTLQDHPACGVVLLTSEIDPELMLRAMQMGVCDVLLEPFTALDLLEAVGRAAQHRKRSIKWLKKETGRITGNLNRRLNELESILKQVNDGVIVLDEEQRVVIVNQTMREVFGLGDGDLTGSPVEEVIDSSELIDLLGRGEDRLLRSEIHAPDGKTYGAHVSHVMDIGIIASLHDISYLKELDRLKGDFVNTVSHDLRSPLTAILGYVELIERAGEVNEQQAMFIQRVKESVESTTKLINDLLNLGRVEVGAESEMELLQLDELVGERVENLGPVAAEKSIHLQIQVDRKLPPVIGNATQLRQVADNLIGNALKYTSANGEVRVLLREQDDQVVLYVGDNGPGIPADEHARIFEKFYRAKDAPEEVEGTGLGLAIVKSIVDNHSGRIWVDSSPGKGSIFAVVLPVAHE